MKENSSIDWLSALMTPDEFVAWEEQVDLQEKYDAIEETLKNVYDMDEDEIRGICCNSYSDRQVMLNMAQELLRVTRESKTEAHESEKITSLRIGDSARLTTDHPASHYGTPVLTLNCDPEGRGYGPWERTYPPKFAGVFRDMRAAHGVESFALCNGEHLSDPEYDFCKAFLSQWPEGPQLPARSLIAEEKKATSDQVDPKLKDELELER